MVLTLYGSPYTSCTKRVAVVLKEKDIAYTFVPIDLMKGEHKSPEFLKKQPFGQVPYIDDDGFQLYESRAIGRYLAAKYPDQGTALLPTELEARACFEQAASVEMANFDPKAYDLVAEKVLKKVISGVDADEAKVAAFTAALGGKLDVYEDILSQQKYVAGDEVTLADLFHLPLAQMVKDASPELISSRPHVAQWVEKLLVRPAWVAVEEEFKSGQ